MGGFITRQLDKYLIIALGVWLLFLLLVGIGGYLWFKEFVIEGPIWFISILFGTAICLAFFSNMHATRVEAAIEQYIPGENDELSEKNLICEPAFLSFGLCFVFLILVYVVIGGVVYNFDLKSMGESISYRFGNIFFYLFYSIIIPGLSIFLFIKTLSKNNELR